MDLDALLHHYLGAGDPATADPATLADAHARIALDFGMEQDDGRRFALWSLMAVLGDAPDPRDAFDEADAREAAFAFSRLLRHVGQDDDAG